MNPACLLAAVRDRRLEAIPLWELAEEIVEVDPPLRDPGDVGVVAAAVAGFAQVVITGDHDLLAETAMRDWLTQHGIDVVKRARPYPESTPE